MALAAKSKVCFLYRKTFVNKKLNHTYYAMQPKTEQIIGTLQVIIEPESGFKLPGHEDGGSIFPFIWEASKQGEFNILKEHLHRLYKLQVC
ncbi:MAG: hypothetical protein V7K33_34190 [Nostoc sp.]